MRLRTGLVVTVAFLVVAAVLSPMAVEYLREPASREQYQLIYQEGPRSWFLDTQQLSQRTEDDTGVSYLDVYVKATYTFTTDFDINKYWLRLDAREWQPISATGCNEKGNVLEL